MEKRDDFEATLSGTLPKLPAYLDGKIKLFEFNENCRHRRIRHFRMSVEKTREFLRACLFWILAKCPK